MGEDAGESDVFPAMHFAFPRTQSGTQRAGNRSVRYTLPARALLSPAPLTRAAVAAAERPAACHPARAAAPATAAHRVCVQRVGGLREAALLPTPGAAAVHQHRACCAMEPVGWLGGA